MTSGADACCDRLRAVLALVRGRLRGRRVSMPFRCEVEASDRAILGFAVAPLVPALLLECGRWLDLASGGLVLVLYAYPAEWLLGVPAFLVFRRAGLTRLWDYVAGGFVGVTLATAAVIAALEGGFADTTPLQLARDAALFGALGAASTAAFWLVAVRGTARPQPPAGRRSR